MFYKKKGFPKNEEIVLCTVKKILPTTVFVYLDEYTDKEGIIHISEIAPGRIRTIRDYVKEGKKILCKILRINTERGSIDLSLRRATKSAQINKNQELKLEQKAEKVLEVFGAQNKKSLEEVYKSFGFKIVEEFGSLNACFEEVLTNGEKVLTALGVPAPAAKKLVELIQIRMKPPEINLTQKVKLSCRGPKGVEVIKESIKKALAFANSKKTIVEFSYTGAPVYKMILKAASDYKSGEKKMEEVTNILISSLEKEGGEGAVVKK